MREEIIAGLIEYFKKHGGPRSLAEYRKDNDVPYPMRDIERHFTDYAEALYLVNQRIAEMEKAQPIPEPIAPVVNKKPTKRQFKRAKEDSLDE
jgi:hypothetical protein